MDDAQKLDRHEMNADIWRPRYNQYGGVMLYRFIDNVKHWQQGDLRAGRLRGLFKFETPDSVRGALDHPQFLIDLELTLTSAEFEELVYLVFVKMHELYKSLQINLAVGYVTMDHPLHNLGIRAELKGFYRNGLPILSPYTVGMMVSFLRHVNRMYFEDREFLTDLERMVKPRKIDELKTKILSAMQDTPEMHTEADRNRAVLFEANRRTGYTFRDIQELERIAPGLYHFDHFNPVNLAKRVHFCYGTPPIPVDLIQAKVLGPPRYRALAGRPSSAVTVVHTGNTGSFNPYTPPDHLERALTSGYEHPAERPSSAATVIHTSNAANSSHPPQASHLERLLTSTDVQRVEQQSAAVTVRTGTAAGSNLNPGVYHLEHALTSGDEHTVERLSAATTVQSSDAASTPQHSRPDHLERASTSTSYVQAGGDTPLSQRRLIDIDLPRPSNANTFSMSRDELFSRLPPNIVPPLPRPPKKEKKVEKLMKKVDNVKDKTKEKIAKVGDMFELKEIFKKD